MPKSLILADLRAWEKDFAAAGISLRGESEVKLMAGIGHVVEITMGREVAMIRIGRGRAGAFLSSYLVSPAIGHLETSPCAKAWERYSKQPEGRRPRSPCQAPRFANSRVRSGKTGSFEVYSSPRERGPGHRLAF